MTSKILISSRWTYNLQQRGRQIAGNDWDANYMVAKRLEHTVKRPQCWPTLNINSACNVSIYRTRVSSFYWSIVGFWDPTSSDEFEMFLHVCFTIETVSPKLNASRKGEVKHFLASTVYSSRSFTFSSDTSSVRSIFVDSAKNGFSCLGWFHWRFCLWSWPCIYSHLSSIRAIHYLGYGSGLSDAPSV